jgi:ElaB/YqjD/DUF883 family membrane-anchored ribosome-binding protein
MGAGSGEIKNDREGRVEDALEQMREDAERDEKSPEAVRAEIEQTRADLGETVQAIQEKLNPQRLREEAVSTVRDATVGRVEDFAEEAKWKVKGAGSSMLDTIKRNPVPAALAAVGLGWLFMESRSNQSRSSYGRYEDRRRYEGRGRYYTGMYEDQGRYGGSGQLGRYEQSDYGYGYDQERGMRERAGEAVGQATGKVGDVAQRTGDKVGEVAQRTGEKAGEVVESAREGVQQVAEQAQYRAEMVKSRLGEMMDDNPLIIGAAALALGAAVGFSLPTTQKENELMGEARDKVMERASEAASETAQKVQRVAEEAGTAAKEAAKSEAEKQNLASEQQGTTGRQHGQTGSPR